MFEIGIKDWVVNVPSEYPITYTGGAGTAADSTHMIVEHFKKIDFTRIQGVRATRAVAGVSQVENVTAATAAEITVGTVPSGNYVQFLSFDVQSEDNEALYARDQLTFGKDFITLEVLLNVGDTAAIVLAKVYNAFKAWADIHPEKKNFIYIDEDASTVTLNGNGFATSAAELVFTSDDNDISWTSKWVDSVNLPSTVITVWAPNVTQVNDPGRGTDRWVYGSVRIDTDNSKRPWAPYGDQQHVTGALYSSIYFEEVIPNDVATGLSHPNVKETGVFGYEIYVIENAAGFTYMQQLLDWLTKPSVDSTGTGSFAGESLELADNTQALDVLDLKDITDATATAAEILEMVDDFVA